MAGSREALPSSVDRPSKALMKVDWCKHCVPVYVKFPYLRKLKGSRDGKVALPALCHHKQTASSIERTSPVRPFQLKQEMLHKRPTVAEIDCIDTLSKGSVWLV